ncbi:PAS domain-containing protein [Flavobacterium psychraquaticum]|uniref:PAS domain-containing protein n=1 Tax=Flavobacterium psychraquaticum TaxID=3103958 RepID=UPI002ACE0483|nr:PAS domain-containing protein [Flavobacterium sp. LB-N7T]
MTEAHDNALFKFHQKSKIVHTPLICWDFFTLQQMEFNRFSTIQKQWKEKEDYFKETKVLLVTNPKFEIVFASKNIYEMNGYYPSEVIGNSPKMFQGPLTSRKSLDSIKLALLNQLPFQEVITNYRKDGSLYECEISAIPKFDSKGNLVNYIAFERIAS